MSKKAKVLAELYRRGRVTREGLEKAVNDSVISQEELIKILGED